METLVFRLGLGLAVALVTLPCSVFAQEPAPAEPAPVIPAPSEPMPEPAPAPLSEPMMAPIVPEPPVVTPPAVVEVEEVEEAAAPSPTVSGYIEAAYHANFSDLDVDRPVPLQSYYTPNGHAFVLHAAHLGIAHTFSDNISGVIELDAGYDASKNYSFPFTSSLFDVQEAYLTYKSGVFSLTAGKFVTYQGIEVIEGPLNPTITRGYLFGLAEPVTHTGVKLHFTSETVDFGIGVVNGWDTITDNNNMKTIIFKLGLKPSDAFMVAFSGTFGSEALNVTNEHRLSLDMTGAWTASDSFALWFQANYGTDGIGADEQVKWFGFGLQPTYTSDSFTFGARVEFFADPDGARTFNDDLIALTGVGDSSYINFTLTPGFILAQGFKLRAELRADIATEEVLGKLDENDPDLGKFNIGAALGAEYVF
jgi:hypothetical protein